MCVLTYSMVQSPSWEANWFAASQEIPTFHGTRRFITALTSLRHPSLSRVSPIQSIYPYPTFWRSILILSTPLRLGIYHVLGIINREQILTMPIIQFENSKRHLKPEAHNNFFQFSVGVSVWNIDPYFQRTTWIAILWNTELKKTFGRKRMKMANNLA